ncbi:MAG TPA: hypothetical protein VL179_13215 [Mycobacterium sp.]|nr:hypothetical protein [Mycobacterium sp.]
MGAPHCRHTTVTGWSAGTGALWLPEDGVRGADLPHSPQNKAPSGSTVPQCAQFTADPLVA